MPRATLYLVATPIGNLEDITFRAVRVLKEADLIACEDTRQTRKLLDHYGIRRPTISYHEHNEAARTPELIARLRAGASIALVSDAGVPLVSDPGYRIVQAAIAEGIAVDPIPGPSAALAALSASGLAANAFHFAGFLPPKPLQRKKALEELRQEQATLIFYEAPHRIRETLEAIEQTLGPRPAVLARELTKLHQEFLRGTPREIANTLAARASIKGEMTILVGPGAAPIEDETPVEDAVAECMAAGMSRMDAIKTVARRRGLSKRELYRRIAHPDPLSPP